MPESLTVLEEIISDVAAALYQKWYNALPQEEKTEEHLNTLKKNAQETTLFIIQLFMNKFNEAAEELKQG